MELPLELATTIITLEEQLRGRLSRIRQAQKDDVALVNAYRNLQATLSFFQAVTVLPFDERAYRLFKELQRQKIRVGTQDLRIAAIVQAQNGVLVTGNRQDFVKIPNLKIEDWSAK